MRQLIVLLLALSFFQVRAQNNFKAEGPEAEYNGYYLFENAVVHISPEKTLQKGSLLIRKGKVVEVGEKISAPKGAIVIDLKGKHIYPSFIDLYSHYGMPESTRPKWDPRPQYATSKKGAFGWNEAIKPELRAAELFVRDEKAAAEYRNIGFGMVLTHQPDGIMRGTSALVSLQDAEEKDVLLMKDAGTHLSFNKGSSRQQYPSSLMGVIALLRQTYYDLQWYIQQKTLDAENLSLDALSKQQKLPQIFEAGDKYNVLRADKVGDEFNVQYIFKTNGTEYQRLEDIRKTNGKLIVPLNFPLAFDVEDPYDAQFVPLHDMKHWELAPSNPARLAESKIPFSLTASDLKEKNQFLPNLRKAVKYGLTEEEALRALTTQPASFIGASEFAGTLEKGKLANFFIASENIFKEEAILYQNWIQGKRHEITGMDVVEVRGEYDVNIDNHIYHLTVKGEPNRLKGTLKVDTTQFDVSVLVKQNHIALSVDLSDSWLHGPVRLGGTIYFDSGTWDGNAELPNGKWTKWSAIRTNRYKDEKKKEDTEARTDSLVLGAVSFPMTAYGFDSLPRQLPVLIKNITVWTNEAEGVLKNTDVLIRDGKIIEVGKILDVVDKSTWVIDGTGKHLTAGIVDEHSHIAINGGVNEGSHSVTAEVSIADCINPDDINIYRQLSGGVVAAQLLHGSANPIGGRSALIKMRWGRSPEEMKIENADGFIKFALGENVKQSNWGENFSVRFPQTRMGVEETFYYAFHKALEYEAEWKEYEKASKKNKSLTPPRKDIQMEMVLEIVRNKRFISCHSYVQSEINMLMHVADSMGFTVNTFTHILEGYKVADKMKEHGVAASTFSDWWAYKYEVIDAIPYNAAILHKEGVLTGINSDDAEMARRLNQEAAKAVKYGGVSEEEALKMVTLNPAKMLHLDKHMGSIKKGKDADVVIWSDHPLSIYAKAEKTFVDGICYFDRDRDLLLRDAIQKERIRLIGKMLDEKKKGGPAQKPVRRGRHLYHCDTMEDYTEELH